MTSMYDLPEYFNELDLDAEQPSDVNELPRLTARAIAARRQFSRKRNAHKAPIPELTEKFDVKQRKHAPLLHFGVPVTKDRYLQFALDHELVEFRQEEDDPMTFFECGAAIAHYFRRVYG